MSGSDLDAAFREWLATEDGRAILADVRARALSLRRSGWRHFGIGALWEAVRYDRALQVGPDAEGWRCNNSWRSRVARLLMSEEPELVGFFETRELRGGEPEPLHLPPTCRACAGQAATHAPGCRFVRGPQGLLFL